MSDCDLAELSVAGEEVATEQDRLPEIATALPVMGIGGTQVRTIAPADRRKCPVAMTYSCTRGTLPAPPQPVRAFSAFSYRRIEALERTCDALQDQDADRCTIDVSALCPTDAQAWFRVSEASVDLRRTIYGRIKGIVRTVRVLGRRVYVDRSTLFTYPEAAEWGRVEVVVAPAFAPALCLITDENKLKAQRNITSIFEMQSPNAQPLDHVFHKCGELLHRGVNPVRFVHRLAAMYVHSRFCVGLGRGQAYLHSDHLPPVHDITSINSWSSLVCRDRRAMNFIPWSPIKGFAEERDSKYIQVFTLAASDHLHVFNEGYVRRYMIPYWPTMPRVHMLIPVRRMVQFSNTLAVEPAFIYEAAIAWCNRYASLELWEEALKVVSAVYWRSKGQNLVGGAPAVAIPLPALDTQAYILAPLLQDLDKKLAFCPEMYVEHTVRMMTESALFALVFGFMRYYVEWPLLDMALELGVMATPRDEEHLYAFKKAWLPCDGASCMGAIQRAFAHFGVPGKLGRVLGRMSSVSALPDYKAFIKSIATNRITSYDVLPWLMVAAEDSAAVGWCNVQPPVGEILPDTIYINSELPDAYSQTASLREVVGVEGVLMVQQRFTRAVSQMDVPFIQLDSRGYQLDFNNFDFCLPDGSNARFGWRLPDPITVSCMLDPTHDRYRLDWMMIDGVPKQPLEVKGLMGCIPDQPVTGGGEIEATYEDNRNQLIIQCAKVLKRVAETFAIPTNPREAFVAPLVELTRDVTSTRASPAIRETNALTARMIARAQQAQRAVHFDEDVALARISAARAARAERSLSTPAWRFPELRSFEDQIHPMLRPLLREIDAMFAGVEDVNFMLEFFITEMCTASAIYFKTRQAGAPPAPPPQMEGGFLNWTIDVILAVPPSKRYRFTEIVTEWYEYVAGGHMEMFNLIDMLRVLDGHRVLMGILATNPDLSPDALGDWDAGGRENHANEVQRIKALREEERESAVIRYTFARVDPTLLGEDPTTAGKLLAEDPRVQAALKLIDDSEGDVINTEDVSDLMLRLRIITDELGTKERRAVLIHLHAMLVRAAAKIEEIRAAKRDIGGFYIRRYGDEDSDSDPGWDGAPGDAFMTARGGRGTPLGAAVGHAGQATASPPSGSEGAARKQKDAPGHTDAAMSECSTDDGGADLRPGTELVRASNMPFGGEWRVLPTKAKAAIYMLGGCDCFLTELYGWKAARLRSLPSACMHDTHRAPPPRLINELNEQGKLAEFMVTRHYGAAGTEHFQQVFAANLPTVLEWPAFNIRQYLHWREWVEQKGMHCMDQSDMAWLDGFNQALDTRYPGLTVWRRDMVRGKMQGGMPIQLTPAILMQMDARAMPLAELLNNKSPNSFDYEITATVVGLLSMGPVLAFEFFCVGVFDEPLDQWHTIFKNWLSRARRSNMLGQVKGDLVLRVRKILNLTIRRKDTLELGNELRSRFYVATPKMWFFHDASDWKRYGSPRARYLAAARDQAVLAWNRTLGREKANSETKTISAFWEQRALKVGSGASTLIKKVDTKTFDERLSPNDRPGKRVMVECLDDDYLWRLIYTLEPMNRATFFIKPEPGRKLRALYSTYDEESFVSAYGSDGQEAAMSVLEGMKIRQTPHDVLDWMVDSEGGPGSRSAPGEYWVSSDYSDYNAEHTLQEMALVQYGLWKVLDEWRRLTGSAAAAERADASLWMGACFARSFINWGMTDISDWPTFRQLEDGRYVRHDGSTPGVVRAIKGAQFSQPLPEPQDGKPPPRKVKTWTPVVNGLYSGSRDTARNNSLIHWIDVQLGREMLGALDHHWEPLSTHICGDDEDIKFASLYDAITYNEHLAAVGHALNPTKQLAGKRTHEFLQLVWSDNERVEKSLSALMATLASGNWYNQLGLWIQTAVESCIGNFWEAFLRGLPLRWAQRLCASYLDRLMYIPPGLCTGTAWAGSGKRLEWWQYRWSDALPPLYKGTEGEIARMPRYEAQPDVRPSWPLKASEAYVRSQRQLLAKIPRNVSREFIETTALDTLGAAMKNWRQHDAKRWCARFWPERINEALTKLTRTPTRRCQTQPPAIWEAASGIPKEKRVVTEQMVYGRMGVSMFIARKLGGLTALGKYLPPRQWAKACNVDDKVVMLNDVGHELQMNIKAALAYRKVPDPRYQGQRDTQNCEAFSYVFMANGSGKSHFVRTMGLADDLDEVWCDLYGAFRENYEAAMPKSSFSSVARVAGEIIVASMRSKGVLLGQLQPALIARGLETLGMRNARVVAYDPGPALRAERMRRRKWDEDKVQRRLARAEALYQEATNMGWTVLREWTELLAWVEEGAQWVRKALDKNLHTTTRQAYEYVFDQTELVTRQLRIQEQQVAA